jgi:SpoVK/Ycf46/Vps4 family AAA+-type ATPase
VQEAYTKWYGNGLKNKAYKAYKKVQTVKANDPKTETDPYKELQNMIGLAEVKKVVDQILATGKIEKMRSDMGLDVYKNSLHMVFTGNPGSAKTSVARLIAEILRGEEILESGRFVEVGRADLIARYVGWTAKTVREKFREASGGILFIDEAYSLVDGSNSFGDEAINTIVQEMENHREDVIVIFAGYPKRMEEFLQKNEGLRSRVAFHLNFPDYTAEEMQEILELLCKKKGYTLAEDVREKSLQIFKEACRHEEFGNGRFARNLLEQAMMNQAKRLFSQYRDRELSKEEMGLLRAEDFDTVASRQYKEVKQIGFM